MFIVLDVIKSKAKKLKLSTDNLPKNIKNSKLNKD